MPHGTMFRFGARTRSELGKCRVDVNFPSIGFHPLNLLTFNSLLTGCNRQ